MKEWMEDLISAAAVFLILAVLYFMRSYG